jgi:hypothetical protein
MIDMKLEVVVLPVSDVVKTYRTKTIFLPSGIFADIN